MIVENSEALLKWMTSKLENLCNGDPGAVAKYVLALVKKDKEENELYQFCSDQLDIFLSNNTKSFVAMLFEALKNKSYLIITDSEYLLKTDRLPSVFESTTKISPDSASNEDQSVKRQRKSTYPVGNNKIWLSERKKALMKECDGQHIVKGTEKIHNLINKGKEKYTPELNGKKEKSQKFPPQYEPEVVYPVLNDRSYQLNKNTFWKKRQRCLDYHEKGYCMQGDRCQLDHGNDPVVVEDVSMVNFGFSSPVVLAPPLPSCPPPPPPVTPPPPPPPVTPPPSPSLPLPLAPPDLPTSYPNTDPHNPQSSPPASQLSLSSGPLIRKSSPFKQFTCSDPEISPPGKKRKMLYPNCLKPTAKKANLEPKCSLKVPKSKHLMNLSVPKDQTSKFSAFQTLNKRLELHKKKQALLQTQIQNEKDLLDQLSQSKSKKTKVYLKQIIQDFAAKIALLEADVKQSSEELMKSLKIYNAPLLKCEVSKKEILDAEMDLYNKQHKGEDTTELRLKLDKMKKMDSISTEDLQVRLNKKPRLSSSLPFSKFKKMPTFDNPDGNLYVYDVHIGDIFKKPSLDLQYEKQLGNINISSQSPCKDQGNKSELKEDSVDKENKDHLHLLDDDDDEEEEDSEPRSWRH